MLACYGNANALQGWTMECCMRLGCGSKPFQIQRQGQTETKGFHSRLVAPMFANVRHESWIRLRLQHHPYSNKSGKAEHHNIPNARSSVPRPFRNTRCPQGYYKGNIPIAYSQGVLRGLYGILQRLLTVLYRADPPILNGTAST